MGLLKKRKVVLCLGGGSARGLANIGVLKVMEKHFGRGKIPVDMIVGTSIGSLIAGAYCLGMPLDELAERARGFSWQKLVDLGLFPTGVIKGDKLEEVIKDCIKNGRFEDAKIPSP